MPTFSILCFLLVRIAQALVPPTYPTTLLSTRTLQSTGDYDQLFAIHEHARQLSGTVGDVTLSVNDTIPFRGGKCFDSYECSWYYRTNYPGKWGDCEGGTCVCEPGYKGQHCESAPAANRFSCSDGQCYDSTKNGRQSEERGGNVTITVVKATNLPDTDAFGVFGGETDAFVKIQIGTTRTVIFSFLFSFFLFWLLECVAVVRLTLSSVLISFFSCICFVFFFFDVR